MAQYNLTREVDVFPGNGPGAVNEGETKKFVLMGIGDHAGRVFSASTVEGLAYKFTGVEAPPFSEDMF